MERFKASPTTQITRLAPLATATEGEIAFVAQARYASQIQTTQAGALIVPPSLLESASSRGPCIVTDDPYLYFARLTQWWRAEHRSQAAPSIHPLASVHATAVVEADVDLAPFVVIGPGARVGRGSRIGAHCVWASTPSIGPDSLLYPRVTVGERCSVGARAILHPGVVIGADGFGFAPHQGTWVKIEQLGAVRIGDDVEIGANTCIDRGALDDTVIEDGVKLDNLIQIGHNVRIGAHSAMAGNAGRGRQRDHWCALHGRRRRHRARPSDPGRRREHLGRLGGHALHPCSRATTPACFPSTTMRSWEKNAASLKQLNRLRERLKAVEQAIEQALPRKNSTP